VIVQQARTSNLTIDVQIDERKSKIYLDYNWAESFSLSYGCNLGLLLDSTVTPKRFLWVIFACQCNCQAHIFPTCLKKSKPKACKGNKRFKDGRGFHANLRYIMLSYLICRLFTFLQIFFHLRNT
jgi:hypothetical protein